MKTIRYKIIGYTDVWNSEIEEAEQKECLVGICRNYSETNEEIAKREAYKGEYTIEDDGQPEPETPSGDDSAVWDELDAAYQSGYDEGYVEGVNGAYVNE